LNYNLYRIYYNLDLIMQYIKSFFTLNTQQYQEQKTENPKHIDYKNPMCLDNINIHSQSAQYEMEHIWNK